MKEIWIQFRRSMLKSHWHQWYNQAYSLFNIMFILLFFFSSWFHYSLVVCLNHQYTGRCKTVCWLVFIFQTNKINHVSPKSISTIQYKISWKMFKKFSSGRFDKRIRQPKLVLWHNSIVKTSQTNLLFSFRVSCRWG